MEGFVKGDVVVIPFPFSDLSNSKRRPALVLSVLDGNDLILCQITGKERRDKYAVSLPLSGFERGSLLYDSIIRSNRLFTADKSIVLYRIGTLTMQKLNETIQRTCEILKN
ncbi:MAG: type II toxin-antitoxin system PemK/MazF family toxin [Candidatus Diapherotrites archaeon]|nr:type II toxin-antitoxin system PemK/MazF family toxin [Candidatus Diapherotrites archaeon]